HSRAPPFPYTTLFRSHGDAIVRGEYCMIPASSVAQIAGAAYGEKDGWAQMTMKDGRVIQFARGCIGCTIDNRVHAMLCEPVERRSEEHTSELQSRVDL